MDEMKFLPVFRLEPPSVYYLHIPKTAGTSLTELLVSAYSAQKSANISRFNVSEFASSDLGRLRCISSHLGNGLLPHLPQENLQKITVLRDPVERVISSVYYEQARLKEVPHVFDSEFVEKYKPYLNVDIGTWLDAFGTDGGRLSNRQAKHLGAMRNPRAYFSDGEIGRLKHRVRSDWLNQHMTEDLDAGVLAERAHVQLEQMAVVGITEHFAETVELVCDLLGVSAPRELPVANVGRRRTGGRHASYRETTPPDVIAQIEAMTTIDQELYAHGRELFAGQLARLRARRRRTISIAPRLRPPVLRVRRAAGRIRRAIGL